ncbi:uncharacterized protein O3C94_021689 isoform 2-T2 [Discoglossus pictus]
MGSPNTRTTRWILLLVLLRGVQRSIGSSKNTNHRQDGNLVSSTITDCSNSTLTVYPMCWHLQNPNFVWTESLSEGTFEHFRFGISLNLATHGSKTARQTLAPHVHVGVKEQVLVTVTAETNQSDTRLIVTSCELESKLHLTRTSFMRDGCLDNRTADEMWREDTKIVFSIHLSSIPLVPGSSVVFVTCEAKLCQSHNQSQACSSGCAPTISVHQPNISRMETQTHKVTAELIYIVGKPKRAATNYAALVIGLVLGGTVVAVVVLLVRKSFAGVRRRNAAVDL